MNKRRILIIAVAVIFLSSAGIVTFLSAQDGGGVAAVETDTGSAVPAPLETRYAPDRIVRTTGSAVWRVSRDLGVLVSTDGGLTWGARNQGLPVRAVYPFTVDKPPIITGLAVDPVDNNRLALSTLDTIFLSGDAGADLAEAGAEGSRSGPMTRSPASPSRPAAPRPSRWGRRSTASSRRPTAGGSGCPSRSPSRR